MPSCKWLLALITDGHTGGTVVGYDKKWLADVISASATVAILDKMT